MPANKTQANAGDVAAFLALQPAERLADCNTLCALLQELTGEPPVMWGSAIVGFGCYHYRYDSGREGDAPWVAFSPRKQDLTIYIMPGFDTYAPLLSNLGKHKLGKSCLYLKRLADVDMTVLRALLLDAIVRMKDRVRL